MKKILVFAFALALLFGLAACGKAGAAPTAEAVLTAKIIEVYDGSMLVAAEDGGLYTAAVPASALGGLPPRAGMTVDIGYNGGPAETRPARLSQVTYVTLVDDGADLVALYAKVVDDLWSEDEALNDGVEIMAFDLSAAENLTAGEKSALLYLAENRYGCETVEGAFDALCERGYIDEDALYFPNGILFEFKNMDFSGGGFTFDAVKWRGGLARSCTANARRS